MVFVIDDNYLVLSLIITAGWQAIFSILAVISKSDKVTDLAYGTNFVGLAVITLILNGEYFVRQIVLTVLVSLWGIRLAGYLFYRIMKIGVDHRFDGVRDNCLKFSVWFFFQIVAVWLIQVPQTIVNAQTTDTDLSVADYVGWAIWLIGFICETVGDHQKFTFRNDPANRGRWCDVGLWKYTRHPNYFGEIACWWGLFISSAIVLDGWTWFSILGPIFITLLLMFGSGVPTTEKSADQKFGNNPDYQRYKKETPVLVPFIPGVFGGIAKVVFCCEYPLYNYPPEVEKIVP